MKYWWGVIVFKCAISGTSHSLKTFSSNETLLYFYRSNLDYLSISKKSAAMNITQIYAIIIDSLFAVLITINFYIYL